MNFQTLSLRHSLQIHHLGQRRNDNSLALSSSRVEEIKNDDLYANHFASFLLSRSLAFFSSVLALFRARRFALCAVSRLFSSLLSLFLSLSLSLSLLSFSLFLSLSLLSLFLSLSLSLLS